MFTFLLLAMALFQNPPAAPTGLRTVDPADKKSSQQEWQVQKVEDTDGPLKEFDFRYTISECEVFTRKDRAGVFVHATERNSNGLFYDSSFTTSKDVRWPKVVNKGTRNGVAADGPHPNVFFPRCAQHAKRLPPDVRQLFFGYAHIQ